MKYLIPRCNFTILETNSQCFKNATYCFEDNLLCCFENGSVFCLKENCSNILKVNCEGDQFLFLNETTAHSLQTINLKHQGIEYFISFSNLITVIANNKNLITKDVDNI